MLADRPSDRLDASGSRGGRAESSPRPARSTWPHSADHDPGIELFARIREGLIRGEHVDRMGMAFWLYEYLQLRCYFTGPHAGTSVATYTHMDAAKVLNRSVRAIKVRMDVLVTYGYVTVAKVNHGLVVTITKYLHQSLGTVQRSAVSCTPLDEPSAVFGKPSAVSCTPVVVDGLSDASLQSEPSAVFGQPLIYVARAPRDSEISETPPPSPPIVPIFFGAPRFPELLRQPVPPVCPDLRRPRPPSSLSPSPPNSTCP